MQWLTRPLAARPRRDEIWAIRDVSFTIEAGEVVGVIGRNGAGKSTLLKLLSRITEPTSGFIRLAGRVGSLLEVGTGFHPELTGRENVFLNGAILGMTRHEIRERFDEIVAFAEVERFLDTPVKHYSSGMFLRLGFAVAAHLEPEILLVDEVLAVGDASFQRRCLGKMGDVARSGRTVVFVSHDEAAVRRLCGRTLVLEQGQLVFAGPTAEAFAAYRSARAEGSFSDRYRTVQATGAKLVDAALTLDGQVTTELAAGQCPVLNVTYELKEPARVAVEVLLRDESLMPVMFCPLGLAGQVEYDLAPGKYRHELLLDPGVLASGSYSLDLIVAESGVRFLDYIEQALSFVVVPTAHPHTGWIFRQARGQGAILLRATALGPPRLLDDWCQADLPLVSSDDGGRNR